VSVGPPLWRVDRVRPWRVSQPRPRARSWPLAGRTQPGGTRPWRTRLSFDIQTAAEVPPSRPNGFVGSIMSSRPQPLPSRLGHRAQSDRHLTSPPGLLPPAFCRCNAVRIALQGSPYLLSYNRARACLADRLGGSEGFELAEGRCGNGCPGCPSSRIGPSRRPVVSNPTIGPRAGSRPVAAVGAPGWRVVRSWPRSSCTLAILRSSWRERNSSHLAVRFSASQKGRCISRDRRRRTWLDVAVDRHSPGCLRGSSSPLICSVQCDSVQCG
jgi:hypothetical protein